LEEGNGQLEERIKVLEKEMFDYKSKTDALINSKNAELISLRSRLSTIDQQYTDQINILLMEKNKLSHTIEVESSEAELLTIKLAVLSNKIKTVIEQKGFLLSNVESCIDNLKLEWEKLKDHCQRQMVISGEKAVQQLEELLVLMINSFEGVKDVIKFMSFEELSIVGFQTKTGIEAKEKLEGSIGVGELGEGSLEMRSEESIGTEVEKEQYQRMYSGTKKKREELNKLNFQGDKRELEAIVEKVKNKTESLRMNEVANRVSKQEIHSESFKNFTQNNFIQGRDPKLNQQPKVGNNGKLENFSKNSFDIPISKDKFTDDVKRFIYPDIVDLEFNSENIEEFLSKHWIELMEVVYGLMKDIFMKVGNIQVSDEVIKLFDHIKSLSNKNIANYIYERLFSKQKLSLDQSWFKDKDRIETLERQKKELKKELNEMHELMMDTSNNSQSITSLPPKSRQQSVDAEEMAQAVIFMHNYLANLKKCSHGS
jgi:hypothetical protein